MCGRYTIQGHLNSNIRFFVEQTLSAMKRVEMAELARLNSLLVAARFPGVPFFHLYASHGHLVAEELILPLLGGGELQPVPVGVVEVDGLHHPMIDGALHLHTLALEARLPGLEVCMIRDTHRKVQIHTPPLLEQLIEIVARMIHHLEERDMGGSIRVTAPNVEENVEIIDRLAGRWVRVDV